MLFVKIAPFFGSATLREPRLGSVRVAGVVIDHRCDGNKLESVTDNLLSEDYPGMTRPHASACVRLYNISKMQAVPMF